MKVCKFGGTSMANADSISRVGEIISSDDSRKYVVVSAPGKREKTDTKVTDLLYACYDQKKETNDCSKAIEVVLCRFNDIISGLGIELDMTNHFTRIKDDINNGASKDYVASRGEYLSAILTAKFLNFEFIDASEIIKFDEKGIFDSEKTNQLVSDRLAKSNGAVIPGFYGEMPNGEIKTFSRGGSDVTGSIIARGVCAELYENWTDVDGFMRCDPRVVDAPTIIDVLTYKELRELSYMGANILHPDSIFPVRKSSISINIKNTFNPSAPGTLIVPTARFWAGEYNRAASTIAGIAGKKDFVAINVEKSMMNSEVGFARKMLSILEDNFVSVEHMPSGIDTMSVIIDKSNLDDKIDAIISQIQEVLQPDFIDVSHDLALIAVVGHGMSRKKGTASKVCGSLSRAGINLRMIDQGSSELNIIVAVENGDYEKSIRALYEEFQS